MHPTPLRCSFHHRSSSAFGQQNKMHTTATTAPSHRITNLSLVNTVTCRSSTKNLLKFLSLCFASQSNQVSEGYIFSPSITGKRVCLASTSTVALRMALSSSELKKTKRKKHKASDGEKRPEKNHSSKSPPKASVVHRLAQAAARARKAAAEASEKESHSDSEAELKLHHPQSSDSSTAQNMASLQDLTKAIDEKLLKNQQEGRGASPSQSRNHKRRKVPGDSMTDILQHNQDFLVEEEHLKSQRHNNIMSKYSNDGTDTHYKMPTTTLRYDVAILLSKPLQRDQITVEHANRIRRLVRAMMPAPEGNNYNGEQDVPGSSTSSPAPFRPNVICFVGHSPGNLVADADAGYLYFQHLCAAQQVSVDNIDIHMVRASIEEGALKQIAFFLQETCVPSWMQAAMRAAETSNPAAPRPTSQSSRQSLAPTTGFPQLHLHFTLVSSDYHLCQLHDLHTCSPGRSPLRALETWSQRSFRTTWSYMYVTTILPTRKNQLHQKETSSNASYEKDPSSAIAAAALFCAKTYKTTQELVPVLQNLRGVVDNREFFHTDFYQVLVSARRSLVADMESLYREQPNLRAVHNLAIAESSTAPGLRPPDDKPVDVVLESALLYLGRCLDLVRPAGLFTGTVTKEEWKLARILLEQSIQQITYVCDPDRPIDPSDWGSMTGNENGSLVDHSGSATREEMTLLTDVVANMSNTQKNDSAVGNTMTKRARTEKKKKIDR